MSEPLLKKFMKENSVIISPTQPKGNIGKVWIKTGKNLYNKSAVSTGIYLTETGGVGTSENLTLSEFIEVMPGEKYSYQGVTQVSQSPRSCYYDKDKNFISAFTLLIGKNTVTIPSNAYYVRHSVRSDVGNVDTFQFEQGPTTTDYEAYIEKEIYVKSDNGVFERFYKEYSLTKILDVKDETYGIRVRAYKQGKIIQLCLNTNSILTDIATGEIGYTLATLPGGARPLENFIFQVQTSTNKRFTVRVRTDGVILFTYNYVAITGGSNEQVNANITFLAV